MLWGAATGALELRATDKGGVRLSGRFPYRTATELASRRRETFESRAFAARVNSGAEIHLLFGHDYDKPLASRSAGSLEVFDTETALEFRATIAGATSWAADFLAAHAAGLIKGLSPGFRVAPGGDEVRSDGEGLLRTVKTADLFEISAVTVPAYPAAQIEARAWETHQDRQPYRGTHPLNRWRL